MIDEFQAALDSIDTKLIKYDERKTKSVHTDRGPAMTVEKFSKHLIGALGKKAVNYPNVFSALHSTEELGDMLKQYAEAKGLAVSTKIEIPSSFKDLTLNLDLSHTGQYAKFFLTTPDDFVSPVSGSAFIKVLQLKENDAVAAARKVFPLYLPRNPPGVSRQKDEQGVDMEYLNTYVPPAWTRYEGIDKLPDRLPASFEKLINHLFPLKEEREYFFSWAYHSLFSRAFVYLILCGAPGTGKNRLKLVLRALHGHSNTIDGKKSTLVERFNSQLADATLAWFDELHYDLEMENVMKELQNDSISIEKKGIDATRSTRIFASLIISNNKPRDNHIAFDGRKFAPLVVRDKRLDESMTPAEINDLTNKVEDWSKPTYDIAYIAQIGKWIKKHGKSKKWPNLEYRGPMFWALAHTSMSRWQKKAALLALDSAKNPKGRLTIDPKMGVLWSSLHDTSQRKNGDRSLQFPEFSSVKHFFDIFRDSKGQKVFETTLVPDSIMGDFWIKVIASDVKIMTEAQVLGNKPGGTNDKDEKDTDYV